MIDAPRQRGARTGYDSAVDLGEAPEEPAVAAVGESREVVRTSVDLLHERCLGIDEPVWLEDSVHLLDHLPWVQHVFQHRLHDHRIDAAGYQRDLVSVRDELDVLAGNDVERQQPQPFAVVQAVDSVADAGPADDQDKRCVAVQQAVQSGDVARGNLVDRSDKPADALARQGRTAHRTRCRLRRGHLL